MTVASTPEPNESITQTLKRVTAELGDYWKPVLEKAATPGSRFQAKIARLSEDYGKQDYVFQCFPNEISGGDLFVELINFQFEFLNTTHRQLYRLPYRSDWKEQYLEKEVRPGMITHLIPFSALELINASPITSPAPTSTVLSTASATSMAAAPAPKTADPGHAGRA
jgi:hypothetical protein